MTTAKKKRLKPVRAPAPDVVPEGWRMDALGRMCHIDSIRPVDLKRDELVQELVGKAKAVSKAIADFKTDVFFKADSFVALSAAQYDAPIGGRKGNVTLTSFDGVFRIVLAISEKVSFDERLQAAKALIDECLNEWAQDGGHELQTIVNSYFQTDGEGKVSPALILSLRRYDFNDKRWLKAMTAIGESLQVIGSKRYMRFYERVGQSEQYLPIPMNVAGD